MVIVLVSEDVLGSRLCEKVMFCLYGWCIYDWVVECVSVLVCYWS